MKGPSVLWLHPTFKMTTGVVVDDLHGLYLGVARTFLSFWFHKSNKGCNFYIGDNVRDTRIPCAHFTHTLLKQIGVCDSRLLSIKVPDVISRPPKSLTDFKHWKGTHVNSST